MPLDLTTNINAVLWQNSVMALMNFAGDVFYSLDKHLKLLKAEPNLWRGVTSVMSSFCLCKDLYICIHTPSTATIPANVCVGYFLLSHFNKLVNINSDILSITHHIQISAC